MNSRNSPSASKAFIFAALSIFLGCSEQIDYDKPIPISEFCSTPIPHSRPFDVIGYYWPDSPEEKRFGSLKPPGLGKFEDIDACRALVFFPEAEAGTQLCKYAGLAIVTAELANKMDKTYLHALKVTYLGDESVGKADFTCFERGVGNLE
ncbi:MAG: hypothetical protein AAFV47_07415 [Pseudomonadota bacterium]